MQLKNELKKKENIIKEKEKEINEYKLINNQLIQDNTVKQEKIQELMENSQQESIMLTLENLKQEIKEHKKNISDLSNKNQELNQLLKKNNINNINNISNSNKYLDNRKTKNIFEKRIDMGDDYENSKYHSENRPENRLSRISGITATSVGLTDEERIIKYKSKLKEYKEELNTQKIQMNVLKEEIKDLNNKLKNPITKNLNEFIRLFKIAFSGYKPNNKEQKNAFEEINLKYMAKNL